MAYFGPLSYEVRDAPNTVWRRHVDQLRESAVTPIFDKEHCTPQLNPAVLVATLQLTSSVRNERLQRPTTSVAEETSNTDEHVNNAPNNPPSSQNELHAEA